MLSNSMKLCVIFLSFFVLASCSNTSKVINQTAASQKAQFEGKVVDEETRNPIPNATIWVEGTTIQTKSDDRGGYSITLPKGYYEIFAEAEGYTHGKATLLLENSNGRVHDFLLEKKLSRGAYTNSAESDTNSRAEKESVRKENIQKFTDHYINNDLECELQNPQDITFADSEEEGLMWIKDPVELVVVNRELGYKIRIKLNEYVSKEYSEILGLNVDADYFFEEMDAITEEQAEHWVEKRNYHFKGSLRHFLIAMASDKSPRFFGYRLYSGQFVSSSTAMAYSSSSVSDVEKQKYELFFPNNLNGNTVLKIGDELRIEYVEKGVDDPDHIMGLDMYKHQTSWLSLNGDSIEFTNSGMFTTPLQVEVKGVWRYTPVCKMVPKDYLPPIER